MVGGGGYEISFIIVMLATTGLAIRSLLVNAKDNMLNFTFRDLRQSIKEHKCLLILSGAELLVAIYQAGSEPRWDGAYLFQYQNTLMLTSLFNINSLSFAKHISMSYCAINEILAVLFGDLLVGMTAGNIIVFVCSIFSVYGIIKMLLKNKTDFEYAILTGVYGISPFILGLVNYNYWDYWVITLFPIVIYFAMAKRWFFHLITALILCFVKETAIVAYAFYCVGLLISDWLNERGDNGIARTLCIFKKKRYFGMLVVGLSWLIVYIKLPNWDGVGAFNIDTQYILRKLSVFYGFQFNWILTLSSIIAIIWIAVKRKKEVVLCILPILLSDVAFVTFSCLFKTVNHARYIDSHISVLIILAIYGIGLLVSKIGKYICIIGVLVLTGVSNYTTIDPLSLHIFPTYNAGKTMIVTTSGEILSDSMVYNQQYRYFDKALDKALVDVWDDGIICFPAFLNNCWFFNGFCNKWTPVETYEITEQYWDSNEQKRVIRGGQDKNNLKIYNITSECNLSEILNGETGYFFYFPIAGADLLEFIDENADIIEKKTFEYKGFVVNRVKFVQ